ncbi:hypothetical protein TrCOL_g3378 [Triparma columacea]|uniref:tRNA:m(4)X modification enzyme TRM13 n=1 Tax=Triparma columacea TaxID=722753 RepID=A0A9W7GLS8_9STRA|nr:hypothetical protein TrCOL_g3378 [Triparma columacea]
MENSSTTADPTPPPGWDRCHSYHKRKSRFCRMHPLPGLNYCGTHRPSSSLSSPLTSSSSSSSSQSKLNERVPCPLDPSHTVFKHKLTSHLKKCPKAKLQLELESQPYYKKGCNRPPPPVGDGLVEEPWSLDGPLGARTLANSIVLAFAIVYPKGIPLLDLSNQELEKGFEDAMRRRMVPLGTRKHVLQQASILGHMRRTKLLPGFEGKGGDKGNFIDVDTVVEMGAGRGMLGYAVAGVAGTGGGGEDEEEVVLCQEISSEGGRKRRKVEGGGIELCMVERGGTKRKADTRVRNDVVYEKHKEEDGGGKVTDYRFNSGGITSKRIRCDLEHVRMQAVVSGLGRGGGVLVVAKHLCGQGTDLALRGIGGLEGEERERVKGIVMATCCHGVCDMGAMVGGEFMEGIVRKGGWKGGWGEREFQLIMKWTGATTSEDGNRRGGEGGGEKGSEEKGSAGEAHTVPPSEGNQDTVRLGAGSVCDHPSVTFTKQHLGRCAQRIIDKCRAEWVREEMGFEDAKVVYYVGEDVTPQNALIIGTKGGGGGEGRKEGGRDRA